MAATTMPSLIPSVSILLAPSLPGLGGGDSSAARDAGVGFSSLIRIVGVDVVRGGLMDAGDGAPDACERFDFLTGGSSPSAMVLGGDGWEMARERFGTVMPSSDRESDLRLVL